MSGSLLKLSFSELRSLRCELSEKQREYSPSSTSFWVIEEKLSAVIEELNCRVRKGQREEKKEVGYKPPCDPTCIKTVGGVYIATLLAKYVDIDIPEPDKELDDFDSLDYAVLATGLSRERKPDKEGDEKMEDYSEWSYEDLEDRYHELSGVLENYDPDSPTYWELKDELNEIESAMQYASDDEDEEFKYEEYNTEDDE